MSQSKSPCSSPDVAGSPNIGQELDHKRLNEGYTPPRRSSQDAQEFHTWENYCTPSGSPVGEMAIDENDIIVAIMGATGSGKSTFIDLAVGRSFGYSAGRELISCTSEVRPVRYPYCDGIRNVVLVDTPGFDDTFMTDTQILRNIAHWLNATYGKDVKLTGVLYIHRISDSRVSGTPLRNYNMFKELCGKDNFKNVLLVTTMWDEVTEEVGSAREQELQSDFWRTMINLGSTTRRFEGTAESAWKIINSLSMSPPTERCPLQIQREMVDEHVPLHRTTAGRALLNTLTGLMSGFKGLFKPYRVSSKRKTSPIAQHPRRTLLRSPSLLSSSTASSISDHNLSVTSRSSHARTGMEHHYGGPLSTTISALRTALGVAELVRIPTLKDAIASCLSITLSIETMTGTPRAFFQLVETAASLITIITEHATRSKLSADVQMKIRAFSKEMRSAQGIVQDVAQRKPDGRYILQRTDVRIISSCANSMTLTCDALRSALSAELLKALPTVYEGLEVLRRTLETTEFSSVIDQE